MVTLTQRDIAKVVHNTSSIRGLSTRFSPTKDSASNPRSSFRMQKLGISRANKDPVPGITELA